MFRTFSLYRQLGLVLIIFASCSSITMTYATPSLTPTLLPTPSATPLTPLPTYTPLPTVTPIPPTPTTLPVQTLAGWKYINNDGWCGYAVPLNGIIGIRATWQVPLISNRSNLNLAELFEWVGIGGVDYTHLIQIGIGGTVDAAGETSYFAWYERWPMTAAIDIRNFSVSPGDSIAAQIISTDTKSDWQLTIKDSTNDQSFVISLNYSVSIYADFILEDPGVSLNSNALMPFPFFSRARFSSSDVETSKGWYPFAALSSLRYNLWQNGLLVAYSSSPLSADSFDCNHS